MIYDWLSGSKCNLDLGTLPPQLFPHAKPIQTHRRAEARASVARVFFSHDFRHSPESRDIDFEHRSCNVGDTSFNFIRYGAEIDVTVSDEEPDRYVLVAPLSGHAEVSYLNQEHQLDPGSFVILQPGEPFDFAMSDDHSHIAVGFTSGQLKHAIATQYARPLAPRRFVSRTTDAAPSNHLILDFLFLICGQARSPAFAFGKTPLSCYLERTFLATVAEFMVGAEISGNSRGQGRETPEYVLLAEAFMKRNIEEEIHADDVAAAAGVPVRTLYHAFRQYRGVSPLSWMKTERLKAARRDFLDPGQANHTVTEIANRYWSSNLGRFSRQYYEQFGEYPSETLNRGPLKASD